MYLTLSCKHIVDRLRSNSTWLPSLFFLILSQFRTLYSTILRILGLKQRQTGLLRRRAKSEILKTNNARYALSQEGCGYAGRASVGPSGRRTVRGTVSPGVTTERGGSRSVGWIGSGGSRSSRDA